MTEATNNPAVEAAASEAQRIARQLMKEGGRGAVLLGAARLDLALEKLLKCVMQPNVGGDDNLFDSDRPLGTFSAKIALAHRLSLIDKAVEHALQMVRRVRNDFAHSFEDASLTEQSHRNRLSRPYAEARKSPLWTQLESILKENTQVSAELREYICLIVILVSFMEACAHLHKVITPTVQVQMHDGIGAVKTNA